MTNRLRKLIGSAAALSLAATPVAASADTRATDSNAYYSSPALLQAGALPRDATIVPEDDDDRDAAIWYWLLGGTVFFAALSLFVSNEPGASTPTNQSNGAN